MFQIDCYSYSDGRELKDEVIESFEVQFENLRTRINDRFNRWQQFLQYCFCNFEKFYLYSPSFEKAELDADKHGNRYLRNITLLVENKMLRSVIGEENEVLFIGQIAIINGIARFQLTSFSIAPKFDKGYCYTINDEIHICYRKEELYGKSIHSDVVSHLINSYPVRNKSVADGYFQKWEQYIEFREKYLKNVGRRTYALNAFPEIIPVKSISLEDADVDKIVIPEEQRFKDIDDGEKEVFVFADKNDANVDYVLKVVVRIEHDNFLEEKKAIKQLKSFVRNGLVLRIKGQNEERNFDIGDGREVLVSRVGRGEWEQLDFSGIENRARQRIAAEKNVLDQNLNNDVETELSEFKRNKLPGIIDEKVKEFIKKKKVEIENDSEIKKSVAIQIRHEVEKLEKEREKEKCLYTKPEEIELKYNTQIQQVKGEIDLRITQKQTEKLNEYCDRYRNNEEKNIIEAQKKTIKNAKEPNYKSQYEESKKEIMNEAERAKEDKQKAEAARLFSLYFKLEDPKPEKLKKYQGKELVLAYDDRGEKSKLERQKKSLAWLKKGRVKNPAMTQWLFDAKYLPSIDISDVGEIDWQLQLNDIQKDAVRKVLSCNSIFLLQGPPGTGKTQVIAEMTAQFVLRGKKVVIASETHKAIDNALERIPDIPAIRRIRLNSRENKRQHENSSLAMYNRERLSDNFYDSILKVGEKSVIGYNHYKEGRAEFDKWLSEKKKKILDLAKLKQDVNKKRKGIEQFRQQLLEHKNEKDRIVSEKEQYEILLSGIERQLYSIDEYRIGDVEGDAIARLWSDIDIVKKQHSWIIADLKTLVESDIEQLRREAVELRNPSESLSINEAIQHIREEMEQLRDEEGNPPQEGTDDDLKYRGLQRELREKNKKKKELGEESNSDMLMFKVISSSVIEQKEALDLRINEFSKLQLQIKQIIKEAKESLGKEKNKADNTVVILEEQLNIIEKDIKNVEEKKKQIEHDDDYNRYEDEESALKRELSIMYERLNIAPEERTFDESAIQKLSEKRKSIDKDFEENKEKYEKRRVIYEEIRGYIDNDVKKRDRDTLTDELVKLCNVFGITSSANNKEIGEDNPIDLLKQDIDVVIIDEVSKSSFIDLLRPMLYGKQVVLVGDHKQLPPMYDLKHLKDEEIEAFDIEFDNGETFCKAINKNFTTLVETCFFETLFQQLNNSYKITLNKQYRFHSDIMRVNPFYENMRLGYDGQDGDKEHGLSVVFGANGVVSPSDHVCFVDCSDGYESSVENSTSFKNDREASVVVALLDKIADCTDRLSVGVICTYGLQAGAIKERVKNAKNNLKRRLNRMPRADEPFIVSTVDDFQGDERDIIILSMVRNPHGWRRKNDLNLDFIKDYRRINVAITRPRKLLIVVGAREFLSSERTLINVDGIPGRISVFRDIINHGHLSYAEDIVGKLKK